MIQLLIDHLHEAILKCLMLLVIQLQIKLTRSQVCSACSISHQVIVVVRECSSSGLLFTGVLSKSKGDLLKSISECAHCVLLNSLNFIGFVSDLDRAAELGGTTTSDDGRVLDHVTDDADGVMEGPLSLVEDVGTTSTENNAAGSVVLAPGELDDLVFTDHHLFNVFAATERRFIGLFKSGEDIGPKDS